LVANNGKVEIEFYKEQSLPHWISYKTYVYPYVYPYPYPYRRWDSDWYTATPDTLYYSSSGNTADLSGGNSVTISNADSNSNVTLTAGSSNKSLGKNPCKEVPLGEPAKCMVPMEETGRVEKGSKSKQKFHKTNYDFESYASHTEDFQIFPLSKRAVTIQEATREYCTECGKRRKKNYKFCPKCGQKF
jgi:hypothetical protein